MMKCLWITVLLLLACGSCDVWPRQRDGSSCHFSSFNYTDFQHCTNINYQFQEETVELNGTLALHRLEAVVLDGNHNGSMTTISCLENSGLKFESIEHLTISHVHFYRCGAVFSYLPTDSKHHTTIRLHYGVLVINSSFVEVQDSSFTDSQGTGLVIRNSHNITISGCKFMDNSIPKSANLSRSGSLYVGGGGLHLELSCGEAASAHCSNSVYSITGCEFVSNHATREADPCKNFTCTSVTGIGNGGGMGIWLWNASVNHITVKDSMFMENTATWGGGMQVAMSECSSGNTVNVEDCLFHCNSVSDNGGGGVDVGYIGGLVQQNEVIFMRLNITGNRAVMGGGLSIFTFNVYELQRNAIKFNDSRWVENTAHYGAAVNIAPQRLDMQNNKNLISFTNCTFESNGVVNADPNLSPSPDPSPSPCHNTEDSPSPSPSSTSHSPISNPSNGSIEQRGEGIIMVTGGVITFQGNIKFVDNNSTCIYAVSAIVHFAKHTNAMFLSNSARSGAGLALIGYSLIVVAEYTSITFCNNTVLSNGAAIYYFSIDKNAYVSTRTCFIQKLNPTQNSSNVYFNFLGNRALKDPVYANQEMKPDAIYASSLASCLPDSQKANDDFPYKFKNIGTFQQCDTCSDSISDDFNNFGQSAIKCNTNYTNPHVASIEKNIKSRAGTVSFIPGEKFEVPLELLGNDSRKEILYDISIKNHGDSNITLPPLFTVISRHKIILFASPGDRATVTLTEVGFRKYVITFLIEAMDCQPLHKLKNNSCECYPSEELAFVEFHKCSRSQGRSRASIRLGYWIDYMNTTSTGTMDRYALLSSYCPLGYCSFVPKENYRELPQTFNRHNLSKSVCCNRTDTLCGLCNENMTVYFHSESFKCEKTDKCHLGPLFYLLSEILPLTLLFLVVIIFNIRSFTSGNLNGFIFFAQMYDTISKIGESFIPHSLQFSNLSVFHRVVYKIFNIDFFGIDELSFCLFRTRKTLDILMMKYVSVGYAFVLVVGTIWIIRCCSKFRCVKVRKSKYSIIQGLSAFLVMVYSQSTYVSFAILNMITIYKGGKRYKNVVFFQGNFEYFSIEHLPYAIPALFFLTIMSLIPLILIMYPLCNKVLARLGLAENRFINKLLVPITKIKPLLDCFQGTFKDEYRFFAGFYFLYRVSILSSRLFTGVILIFIVIEIQLIAMIAIHAVVWPYQRKIHNVIDLAIFVILAIINSLKLLNFFYAENGETSKSQIRVIHWFQLVFIYIPLVGLCLWVAYMLVLKLRSALKRTPRRVSTDSDMSSVGDRYYEGSGSHYDDFLGDDHRERLGTEGYHMMKQKKLVTFSSVELS